MGKESPLEITNSGVSHHHDSPPVKNDDVHEAPRYSSDKDTGLPTCRVCQCAESDRRGDAALGFLGITPPVVSEEPPRGSNANQETPDKKKKSGFIELISPDGEVFVCADEDIEMGAWQHRDTLLELGCSCKNDLALVHYACALKWFVNHGSTVCEICGSVAANIRTVDLNRVVIALKDYAALRERTADGDPNPVAVSNNNSNTSSSGIDPDAVAAIRRQRLSEISLWFGPHCTNNNNNNSSNSAVAAGVAAASQVTSEQPLGVVGFDILPMESRATKWAVEGTGILLATGLLTVTLAWLIAPRVGKRTAKSGLHILLGGLCALTVVIFFRFVVLTRIRYGPARYWAILFVFWFLVFGIWASRSHAHASS